jgi:hypothetical protein
VPNERAAVGPAEDTWRTVEVPFTVERDETLAVPVDVRCPDALKPGEPLRFVGHVSVRTADALHALVRRIVLARYGLGYPFERVTEAVASLVQPSPVVRARQMLQDNKMLHIPGLDSEPVWDPSRMPWLRDYAAGWRRILAEWLSGRAALAPTDHQRHLVGRGQWDQYHVVMHGTETDRAARDFPETTALVRDAGARLPIGRCYFSVFKPGTVVLPHCAPHNARIRVHLGLVTPPGAELVVLERRLAWNAGELLVFDDSYWHNARHDGSEERVVLIVDFVHPSLSPVERSAASAVLSVLQRAQELLQGAAPRH